MTEKIFQKNYIPQKLAESNAAYFYVLPISAANEILIAGFTPTTFLATRGFSWLLTNVIVPPVMWYRKKYHKKKEISEESIEKDIRKTDRNMSTKLVIITRPFLIAGGLLLKQLAINYGIIDQNNIELEEVVKNVAIGTIGGGLIIYNIGGHLFKFTDMSKELLHFKPIKRLKESIY